MWSTYLALACTVTILASQVVANPGDPAVTSNGVTYIGTRNAKGHSVFKSIPYAVPPVGRLRSQPPQRLTQPEGTVIDASNFAFACHKNSQASTGSSEDCLYLQLLAPPNVTETSNLPVIVYVLGGSFTSGSPGAYDGQYLLSLGQSLNTPVIFITMNYRLGGYGFLVGQEARDAGYDNVGLKDQRAALEWVQSNIQAFGGDPNRVLLTGQSSGAISVALHMLRSGGVRNLFSSAMMWSGSAVTVGIGQPATRQAIFDQLLKITGCTNAASVFDCLGALDEKTYHSAAYSASRGLPAYMWTPQIDGDDVIPDSPSTLIKAGNYAPIPFISGNVLDEGTQFVYNQVFNTQEQVKSAVTARFPENTFNDASLSKLLAMYSPLPQNGSPFGTNAERFGMGRFGKLANAVLGDIMFQAARRFLLSTTAQKLKRPCWSYEFVGQGSNVSNGRLGIPHGADIPFWFNQKQDSSSKRNVAKVMAAFWLNFAATGNPNRAGTNKVTWPEYGKAFNAIRFDVKGNKITVDNARAKPIGYINQNPSSFFHKR